ncbi:MAG TPA: hypothetical protein G4O14_07995 [Anaerolineae bacterium]|nr:hypothetical protein [Anaerolineae bacterium]
MDSEASNKTDTSFPTTYQITIKGLLSEHWADWFNGTLISFANDSTGKPHTILTCQVRDQAELYGILNRLNNLNMALLEVTYISDKGEDHV